MAAKDRVLQIFLCKQGVLARNCCRFLCAGDAAGPAKCHHFWDGGRCNIGYYIILDSTLLHSTPLYSTLLNSTPRHSTPLHSTPRHSTQLHSTQLHSSPLHSTPLHALSSTPLSSAPLQSTLLYSVMLHCTVPLRAAVRVPKLSLGSCRLCQGLGTPCSKLKQVPASCCRHVHVYIHIQMYA